MFSEYASRFLAQSQSRLSTVGYADNNSSSGGNNNSSSNNNNNNTSDRPIRPPASDWQSRGSRLAPGRSYLGRPAGGNPYQTGGTGGSRFGTLAAFGSRYASQDAPLFQAALEQEEEDDEERDREAADLYALQRSRRIFAASRLEESTENEEDGGSQASLDRSLEQQQHGSRSFGERTRGIRSSWNGARSSFPRRGDSDRDRGLQEFEARDVGDAAFGLQQQQHHHHHHRDSQESGVSESEIKGGKMEDVGLESTIVDSEPPADITVEAASDSMPPPAFQTFKSAAGHTRSLFTGRRGSVPESASSMHGPAGSSPVSNADHATLVSAAAAAAGGASDGEIFKHDPFFAWLFLIAQAALFSTSILVYLHTTTKTPPLGDTIYTTLRASFDMLAVDTIVSVLVSLVWLAALRSFVRPLVALIMVAVPVVLVSFSLYPFISSYQGSKAGTAFQDTAMRWAAVVPAVSAAVWVYLVWQGRHALNSAIKILEFCSRILAANSALILVGMACLAAIVLWTWLWLAMFTRVFLGGYFSSRLSRFIISASSWWLGAYFVLVYIWTISVISGVQRGTTAATVSQWYFHRNAMPAPSSREVVAAALNHAVTTIFGTISLSTLLALAIRLPLLVLPRRAANLVSMFAYRLVPTPIAALTNPLTLTYAAIHSQSLATAARGLSQMDFASATQATATLTIENVSSARGKYSPLLPYKLAKLILHATRFIMAVALGFAGWVITARQLTITVPDRPGLRGSAYAYVVGLIAGFIGWGVLGAMEGILGGIVDAVAVCYGSEKRMVTGGGGYCMEAAALFGGRRGDDMTSREEVY